MDGNTICFEADQRALRITYQEQVSVEWGNGVAPTQNLQFTFMDYSPE